MEEERLHAARLEFGQLVADDLRQHLGELHAQRLVDERVEAEVEQPSDHLQHSAGEGGEPLVSPVRAHTWDRSSVTVWKEQRRTLFKTKRLLSPCSESFSYSAICCFFRS